MVRGLLTLDVFIVIKTNVLDVSQFRMRVLTDNCLFGTQGGVLIALSSIIINLQRNLSIRRLCMDSRETKSPLLPEFTGEDLLANAKIASSFLGLNYCSAMNGMLPSFLIHVRKRVGSGIDSRRHHPSSSIAPLITYLFLLYGEDVYHSGSFTPNKNVLRRLFSDKLCDKIKSKSSITPGSSEDIINDLLTWDSVSVQYEEDTFNPLMLVGALKNTIDAAEHMDLEARLASGEKLLIGAVYWIRKMVEDGRLHYHQKKGDGWYPEEWIDSALSRLKEILRRTSCETLYCGVPRRKWVASELEKHLINVDPSTSISGMTHIGEGVSIEPFVWVNPLSRISDRVTIGSHSRIGSRVHIGNNVRIGSGVRIGNIDGVEKSIGVVIEEGCEIGDNCVVGDNVVLKRGAKLHPGTIFMAGTPIVGLPDRKSEESHSYGEVPEYTFIGQSTCDSKRMPGVHVPCVVVLEEE